MYQAGIKNITLYENKGISFYYYDPLNLKAITDLSGLGAVITIENLHRPEVEFKHIFRSGHVVTEIVTKFKVLGLNLESEGLILQLKQSIYGWCPLIEFYDGTKKFYNVPLFCGESGIKPQSEMSFDVELKTAVSTTRKYLEYTAGVSSVTAYRADTTLLRADSTIYTADYAL